MSSHSSDSKRAPSQRQLRVGEALRQALAEVFMRNEIHDPELDRQSITVSEVRISPDLKNATAYVTPLAGSDNAAHIINRLNASAIDLRKTVSKRLATKYSPKLYFKLDRSFDEAGRINQLLSRPEVLRDVGKDEE
jgi:ribosome-binding factor A